MQLYISFRNPFNQKLLHCLATDHWARGFLVINLWEIKRWDAGGLYSRSCNIVVLNSGNSDWNKRESDVGPMLTVIAKHALVTYKPISDRILTARFWSRKRNISVAHLMNVSIIFRYRAGETPSIRKWMQFRGGFPKVSCDAAKRSWR